MNDHAFSTIFCPPPVSLRGEKQNSDRETNSARKRKNESVNLNLNFCRLKSPSFFLFFMNFVSFCRYYRLVYDALI